MTREINFLALQDLTESVLLLHDLQLAADHVERLATFHRIAEARNSEGDTMVRDPIL